MFRVREYFFFSLLITENNMSNLADLEPHVRTSPNVALTRMTRFEMMASNDVHEKMEI
jgi:hypothetical protein